MEILKIGETEIKIIDNYVELSVELPTEPGEIPITRTTTIKLPMTPELAAIFDVNGYQGQAAKAQLITSRFMLEGLIYPTQTFETERGTTADVILLSGNAGWVQKIKEKSMKDLNTSTFDHVVNLENVVNSWDGSKPYCYYTADRGDELLPNERTLYEFRPAFKISALLKEIFKQAGARLISNTLNASSFEKYFVMYEPDDNPRNCESIDYRRCFVKKDIDIHGQQLTTSHPISLYPTNERVHFSTSLQGGINDELYSEISDSIITPSEHNNLSIWIHVRLFFSFRREYETTFFCNYLGEEGNIKVHVELYSGFQILSHQVITVTNSNWGDTLSADLPINYEYGTINNKYYVIIRTDGYVWDKTHAGIVWFEYRPNGFLKYAPSGWWTINDKTNLNKLLPDETQAEFLAKIANTFDLVFAADIYGTNVYCETRANWLNSFANEIKIEDLIGSVQWQAAPRLENNIERYQLAEDGKDKGQYAVRKNKILNMKISNPAIMSGTEDYTFEFSDTIFKGWMLRLYSEPLTYEGVPYTWGFEPRLLYHAGRQQVSYRINGIYQSWQVPVWQAVNVDTIAQWHAARRLQLELGKEVRLKTRLGYDIINKIIAQGGIRTPLVWRGQQYYLTNMLIRSDSDIVELTLLPLISYTGEINGEPLPNTIPPLAEAAAGGDNILISAEDVKIVLS